MLVILSLWVLILLFSLLLIELMSDFFQLITIYFYNPFLHPGFEMVGNEAAENNSLLKPELTAWWIHERDDAKNILCDARTTLHVQSHLYVVNGIEH